MHVTILVGWDVKEWLSWQQKGCHGNGKVVIVMVVWYSSQQGRVVWSSMVGDDDSWGWLKVVVVVVVVVVVRFRDQNSGRVTERVWVSGERLVQTSVSTVHFHNYKMPTEI